MSHSAGFVIGFPPSLPLSRSRALSPRQRKSQTTKFLIMISPAYPGARDLHPRVPPRPRRPTRRRKGRNVGDKFSN